MDSGAAVETREKWGTVFVDCPTIRGGKFSFTVAVASVERGSGAGIGFAVSDVYDPRSRGGLGSFAGSWAYSRTGKFSGSLDTVTPFKAYGQSYKTGDVVTAEVDVDLEELRFYVNGHDQGVRKCEGIKAVVSDPMRSAGLMPTVVLGSSDGGHYAKLTLVRLARPVASTH